MRLTKIHLENFCQHRRRVVTLPPGLSVIAGPNGVGKSNFLLGIKYGVTGDLRESAGVKDDHICRDIGEDEPALVAQEWEHAGQLIQVKRALAGCRSELVLPGGEKIRRAAQITERMLAFFGVDRKTLDNYVFVPQWRMFDFLSVSPQERAAGLARLCGAEKAEEIWQALGEQLRQDRPLAVCDTSGIERIKQRLEILAPRLAQSRQELAQAKERLLTEQRAERLASRLEALTEAERAARALSRLEESLAGCRDQVSGAWRRLGQLDAQIAQHTTSLKAAQARYDGLSSGWESRLGWEKLRQQHAVIDKRLAEPPPEEPEEVPQDIQCLEGLERERARTDAELSRIERSLAALGRGEAPECPVCGSPAQAWQDRAGQWKRQLKSLADQLGELDGMIAQAAQWRRAQASYEKDLAGWQARQDAARERRAELGELPAEPEQVSQAEVSAAAARLQKLTRQDRELSQQRQEAARTVERLSGRQEELASQAERLRQAVGQGASVEEISQEAASLKQQLAEHRQAQQEELALSGVHKELVRQRLELSAELAGLRKRAKSAVAAAAWVGELEELRELFHRDALPRRMVLSSLESVLDRANEILQELGSSFFAQVDDGLSFWALHADGSQEPAGRLSGGQKMLLALSFRLAVNLLFSAEAGLLVLDEPTVGLDEENLSAVGRLLERLAETARSRGLQIILVTHDARLLGSVDNVIRLERQW